MASSIAVLVSVLLLAAPVGAMNVTQARTYFSDVFRLKGTGEKARFEVFVKHRPTGQPESIGITFPNPALLDLAAAGNWPLADAFSANVSSPAQKDLFARLVRFEYLPQGAAGGGSRNAENTQLVVNKTQFAQLQASSPWALESFAIFFSLEEMNALNRIVCDDVSPCVGDLTPFLEFPAPVFTPQHFYANYLTLTPATGTLWMANQVSTQSVFAQQPGHAQASYAGRVTGLQAQLARSWLADLAGDNSGTCAAVEEGWALGTQVERAGWYPASLRVSYDATSDRFTVAMGQLHWRQSYQEKLDAITKLQQDFDNLKGLMEELLSHPAPATIVVNNEFAGMVR